MGNSESSSDKSSSDKSSSDESLSDKQNKSSFLEKLDAVHEYVSAVQDQPPTFSIGEVGGFNQTVPDPIRTEAIGRALDSVDAAEKKWVEVSK